MDPENVCDRRGHAQPAGGSRRTRTAELGLSGRDADCSGAGGAAFEPDTGRLDMDYRNEHYALVGEVDPSKRISVTVTCDDRTATLPSPVVNRFLTNGREAEFKNPLRFGTEVLSGVYQTSASGVTQYQSTWALR
jgi:hypothetical protein